MSGQITALEVQKRNKERVNVYLDGEFAFGLTMIEAAKLHRGQTLTAAEITDLQAQDAVDVALDRAVNFLSYRPRSIQEVRRNLSQKDIAEPVIEQVIARLEGYGYVDDLAFARFWVTNRDSFKPKGPLALRQELREKGIANAIMEQVLTEVDFSDAAYRAAAKKAPRWQTMERRAFRQKMYEYLARRGFFASTIHDVIDRYIEELAIPDKQDFDYDNV